VNCSLTSKTTTTYGRFSSSFIRRRIVTSSFSTKLHHRLQIPTQCQNPWPRTKSEPSLLTLWLLPSLAIFSHKDHQASQDLLDHKGPLEEMAIMGLMEMGTTDGESRILVILTQTSLRNNIHASLRGSALDWYTVELIGFERRSLRQLPLVDGWYAMLCSSIDSSSEHPKP
jgi:hypothetical protein